MKINIPRMFKYVFSTLVLLGASILFLTRIRRFQISGGEENDAFDGPSDSTGRNFEGKIVRRFPSYADVVLEVREPAGLKLRSDVQCKKWAVLTTIFEPSEAVRRFGYDPSWCLVIVGDIKSSTKAYKLQSSLGSNIIYLNDKDQIQIGSAFVEILPWRSFGRKNVGYLYAIAHGADIIYDFDDDNMHKFWIPESLPSTDFKTINDFTSTGMTFKTFKPLSQKGCQVFNPYPYLGGPNGSWPRGFPLNCLRGSNQKYKDAIKDDIKADSKSPIGVLQSLAENEPDVDAIYRLTQETPFSFRPHDIESPGIVLPNGIYSPYNAQATLHFVPGFWALYLPTSVSGRVSDILRSYVSKRLFDIFGIKAGFLSHPLVVQIRNSHSYLADFNAEIPLYTQTSVLLNYLDSYQPKSSDSSPEVILNLWIGLYERGYVEDTDIFRVQKWLQSLLDIGYKFPNQASMALKPSKSNKILNFSVGTPIYAEASEESMRKASCEIKGAKMWSPDYEDGRNVRPALDSSLALSILEQKVFIGSSQNPSGKISNLELSSVLKDMKSRKEMVSLEKLETLLQTSFVSKELIQESEAIFCHVHLSPCLKTKNERQTIALILGTRFNKDQCSEAAWKDRLQEIKIYSQKNYFIRSQHRFDAEYLRHFTNIDVQLLPLIGTLNTGFDYVAPVPEKNKKVILYFGDDIKVVKKEVESMGKFVLRAENEIPENMGEVLAVIYIPRDVTSYKLNQIYGWNIPIFSPSLSFLRDKHMLSNMSWCKSLRAVPPYVQTWHPIDPGDDKNEYSQLYWWQLSDSFDLPHIVHFEDGEHLKNKLESSNFKAIADDMKKENAIRNTAAVDSWCDLISKIK